MKKIITILLLFIGTQLMGQTIGETKWKYDSSGIPFADSVKPDKGVWYTATEWRMLRYAEECYKDSSWVHTHIPKWNDSCYRQAGDLAHGYYFELVCKNKDHFEWIHKKPTFEGFIEWLKKRQ